MKEGILLEEALCCIEEHTKRIQRTREVLVEEAGGYLLAEDVYAEIDNPPFPRSPVDGYAVRAEDIQGAVRGNPARLKVAGCIYAGEDGESLTIKTGEAFRIMTGAPFPKGADTAVKQEDTDYGEGLVEIYQSQRAFDNYCFAGEDYQKGSLLLSKGTRITFAEQGILSGLGKTKVLVYDKPVIRLFTTGDELCPPGTPLKPGKIYDSNGMMVSSRLRELGVPPKSVAHAMDSEQGLAEVLKQAAKDADLIVTTGGVSVGKKDILHGALELMGAEKLFWRVKLQPGTPTIFSIYQNTLILSLSGNPFGAMANTELLLRPILEILTGDPAFAMKKRKGTMGEAFGKKSKVRRFVRAICQNGNVTLPSGIFSSGAIGTLRGCNCLLDIPAGNAGLEKGQEVSVWML